MLTVLLSALATLGNWLTEWVVILAIWFAGVFSIAASARRSRVGVKVRTRNQNGPDRRT
jgi:hypothetical protein